MIKNEKQLTQSEKQIQMLQDLAKKYKNAISLSAKAQYGALECQIKDLEEEIQEYNSTVNLGINGLEFNISNIEKLIISLRVASGLTQKELANLVGIAEQQIQRYEEQNYHKASFERVIQIIRVMVNNLKLTFEKQDVKRISLFPNIKINKYQEEKIKNIQQKGTLLAIGF